MAKLPAVDKPWRLGILTWRDPSIHRPAFPTDQATKKDFSSYSCIKTTCGYIRRDKNKDYIVASELETWNGDSQIAYGQRTVVKRELVVRAIYLEGRQ